MGKDGDDGEGQEDHAGRASNHQAQDAAMYLHGLTALSRVEESVTGDTPEGTEHRGTCGSRVSLQRQHISNGSERLLSGSMCLAPFEVLSMSQCI